jgi:hypothetical protein
MEGFRNIYQMGTHSHIQPGKTGLPQPVHGIFIALNELRNELCLRNLLVSGTFVGEMIGVLDTTISESAVRGEVITTTIIIIIIMGGRSVGIVRSRTQTMEFSLV